MIKVGPHQVITPIGEFHLLGGAAGWGRKVVESLWKMWGKELAVDQKSLPGEGPTPPLVGDRLEGLGDTGPGEGVHCGPRLTQ
jgi:hypothetical protein